MHEMYSFDKKETILLTNIWLRNYAGSEINCLSLAKALMSKGYNVEVASLETGDPMLSEFMRENILIKNVLEEELARKHYDIIWAHHGIVLDYLIFSKGITADKIVLSSLSPFEPYEGLPSYANETSICLANSWETRKKLVEEGINPDKIVVFPNYVSKEWLSFDQVRTYDLTPKRAAIVSNHVPQELLEAQELLTQRGCAVDIYGVDHNAVLITPEVLNQYDLVITIGKTVQYAMALLIPVYCYDMHGGPGYITADELDRAAFYNFSGRGFPKKSAQVIAEEVIGHYYNNLEMLPELLDFVRETSVLENNIEDVCGAIEGAGKVDVANIFHKYGHIKRNNMALVRLFGERIEYQKLVRNLNAEIQNLNIEIQKRDAEIQRQNAEIQKRDAEIHRQNVENQNLNVLIKNLSGELAAHEAQLDDYKTQQEHDAQHIQNLTVEIQDMSARIHNLNIQHQQLSSQLNCLVNSRSWKITAPLRTMMQKIKSCRLGSLGYRFLKSLKHYGVRATSVKVVNKLRQKWLRPQRSLRKAEDISFHGFVKCARSNGARVFLPGVIEGYAQKEKQRKILFISHEMDLTGAPIVLRNFAMSVLRNGDLPVIISPHAGKLSENIAGHNIPVIVYEGVYSTEFVRRFASLFDIVVVNTIVGSPVIDMLAETSTPVLWWIHEAAHSYYKEMIERLPIEQPGNVSIYCVGSYAEKVLLRYRPTFRTEQLLYHTLDMSANSYNESPVVKDDRLTFAMVGTMQHRKGPDVLADAIMQMPEELVLKSRFLFIGRPVDEYVLQRIDAACRRYPENVQYLGEIPNEKLLSLYQNVDCLICPSRDDPMPCTITEVLLLSVPVICSENTGYAPILRKMGSGKVFPNNNSEVLAKEIAAIVEDRSSLDEMRTLARRTYETHFSEKVFDQNSQKAITDTIARRQFSRSKSVSVVIPTYNAGEEGRRLFEILRNQEGLDRLDIIVVDSGSKDDTVEIARQFGCKVIQIPNEEFSHSYARNLGAQHAETDYLLFMTQDAVPVSKDWINRMVTAVQENNAVAASCREISRPECDLYGQICGFVHNTYMGIVDTDRVMEKPNPWTFESSRKNGQLNDVSCLVRRSVFMRYQFRGNYAEDLDLGLRLISDNFRLMLLSSAPVMHSHTRSAMYHFRRGIVDVVALKRIMPEYPVRDVNVSQAYNRILTTAFMTFYVVRTLLVQVTETITTKQLRKKMWAIYAEAETAARVITKDQIVESIAQDLGVDDGGMRNLVKEILFAAPAVAFDSENFLDVGAFITDQAMSYYDHLGKDISRGDVLDICDTIIKRFGQIVGIVFAEYSMTAVEKDDALDRMIQKYNQGI